MQTAQFPVLFKHTEVEVWASVLREAAATRTHIIGSASPAGLCKVTCSGNRTGIQSCKHYSMALFYCLKNVHWGAFNCYANVLIVKWNEVLLTVMVFNLKELLGVRPHVRLTSAAVCPDIPGHRRLFDLLVRCASALYSAVSYNKFGL